MEQPKPQPFFIGRWFCVRVIESALTTKEIENIWEQTRGIKYEDIPDRHDDYLPLNLWDETPDE